MEDFHFLEDDQMIDINEYNPYIDIYPLFYDDSYDIAEQIEDDTNLILFITDVEYIYLINPKITEYITQDLRNYGGSNIDRILYSMSNINLSNYNKTISNLLGFELPFSKNSERSNSYITFIKNLDIIKKSFVHKIIYVSIISSYIFKIVDINILENYINIMANITEVDFENELLSYSYQLYNELLFICNRFVHYLDESLVSNMFKLVNDVKDVKEEMDINSIISESSYNQCVNMGSCDKFAGLIIFYLCISLYDKCKSEIDVTEWNKIDSSNYKNVLCNYSDDALINIKPKIINYKSRLDIINIRYEELTEYRFIIMKQDDAKCGLSLCGEEFNEENVLTYGNLINGYTCIKLDELKKWILNYGLRIPYDQNGRLNDNDIKFLLKYTNEHDSELNKILYNILYPDIKKTLDVLYKHETTVVVNFFKELFYLGMYFRRWYGPGTPYPLREADTYINCRKFINKVSEKLYDKLENIYSSVDDDKLLQYYYMEAFVREKVDHLVNIIKLYPIIGKVLYDDYLDVTIESILKNIIELNICIRIASTPLIRTAWYVLKTYEWTNVLNPKFTDEDLLFLEKIGNTPRGEIEFT